MPKIDNAESILWGEVLSNNSGIAQKIYAHSLEIVPDPTEIKGLTTDQYALISAKAQGYREAIHLVFRDLPNQRTVPETSPFIDTSMNDTGEEKDQ